jgi:gas vesicle protein
MKSKKFLGGLALGALLAGAVGLFFNPTTGKNNRDKFKKITKKVSEDLVKETAKLKTFSKKEYELIVDRLIKKYSKDDLLKPAVWLEIGNELKHRYKDIEKEVKKRVKKVPAKKGK